MNYGKILNFVTIGLFAISIIIFCIFAFGGDVPDQAYQTPVYTSLLLNWAYVLVFITIICALLFPILRLFTRPKQAMKSFIGIGALAIVFLITYLMADGTPLQIFGYTGPDNIPSTLQQTDMIIFTMYFLFFAAIGSIAVMEILKKVR